MAHEVFISYSSHDKPIADAVCATLEAEKIRCWIAPRDVLPGIPYGQALIEAINDSRILVLLFSSNSNDSPQVMREVERAVSKGIFILPFRIEDVEMCKEMEYYISAPHWLDAMTGPLEEHLGRLSRTVSMLLEREPEADGHGHARETKHVEPGPRPRAHLAAESVRVSAPSTHGSGVGTLLDAPGLARPTDLSEWAQPEYSSTQTSAATTSGNGSSPALAMAITYGAASASPATASIEHTSHDSVMTTSQAFLRRLAATAIDGVIQYVLGIVGLAFLWGASGGQSSADLSVMASHTPLVWASGIVVAIGYCGGMLAARGQTLGKMALGLRVAGPDGGNPCFWRAALRETIGKMLSGYVLLLGYLWMLWDGEQQTWHDKIAHTHVQTTR